MPTNQRYITTKTLDPFFIDKNTGQPLAGGIINFYKDTDRATPKLVYQITGAGVPPVYTFATLPNPVTLSDKGTIMNAGGNDVALYYLPYENDLSNVVELYYVEVRDSLGNLQFTREAWPDFDEAGGPENVSQGIMSNQISNSQFVELDWPSANQLSITYAGAAVTTKKIAPDWYIEITHNGAGTLTIDRNSIAGSLNTPTNPPYTITITPGANSTGIKLYQTLPHNPDLWVPAVAGQNGYINTGILLGDNTGVTINYVPSIGTTQQLLIAGNATGATAYYNGTVQLEPGNNTAVSDTGSINIEMVLSTVNATTISSVQVLGLESSAATVAYQQESYNRQIDHLFHDYYAQLSYNKGIKSYLEAWDFTLNPAQLLTDTVVASATGANKSKYVWDQTIIFQTTDSGVGVTRNTLGSLRLTSADVAGTQMALIQYQEAPRAKEILNDRLSCMVSAAASVATAATVSLWYTVDVALPVVTTGTNDSLVLTLDANGKPATFNGNWTEVPRIGAAQFTIGTTADSTFNRYGLNSWDLENIAGIANVTFFAIVVGTAAAAQNVTIDFDSISLVPGDIPTPPAPQSMTEVINDCKRYYEKSFPLSTLAAQNVGLGTGEHIYGAQVAAAAQSTSPVSFKVAKRAVPTIVTYNPAVANDQARNINAAADCAGNNITNRTENGFTQRSTGPGGGGAGNQTAIHWSAEARLGIV